MEKWVSILSLIQTSLFFFLLEVEKERRIGREDFGFVYKNKRLRNRRKLSSTNPQEWENHAEWGRSDKKLSSMRRKDNPSTSRSTKIEIDIQFPDDNPKLIYRLGREEVQYQEITLCFKFIQACSFMPVMAFSFKKCDKQLTPFSLVSIFLLKEQFIPHHCGLFFFLFLGRWAI